jgi:hypothetical protein
MATCTPAKSRENETERGKSQNMDYPETVFEATRDGDTVVKLRFAGDIPYDISLLCGTQGRMASTVTTSGHWAHRHTVT